MWRSTTASPTSTCPPRPERARASALITALEGWLHNRVMVTPPHPTTPGSTSTRCRASSRTRRWSGAFARLWREGRQFGLHVPRHRRTRATCWPTPRPATWCWTPSSPAAQAVHRRPRRMGEMSSSATEHSYIGDAVEPGEGLLISAIRLPITDDFPKGPLYDLEHQARRGRRSAEIRRAAREAEESAMAGPSEGGGMSVDQGAAPRRAHRGRRGAGDRARRPGKRLGGCRRARRGGRPRRNGEGAPFQPDAPEGGLGDELSRPATARRPRCARASMRRSWRSPGRPSPARRLGGARGHLGMYDAGRAAKKAEGRLGRGRRRKQPKAAARRRPRSAPQREARASPRQPARPPRPSTRRPRRPRRRRARRPEPRGRRAPPPRSRARSRARRRPARGGGRHRGLRRLRARRRAAAGAGCSASGTTRPPSRASRGCRPTSPTRWSRRRSSARRSTGTRRAAPSRRSSRSPARATA